MRLSLLLRSIEQTNGSEVPMIISVPDHDTMLLKETVNLPSFVTLIADEQYTITEQKFAYGWLQQQVCKLCVHKTGFASSYLMIDSDSYIINRICPSIFHTDGRPNVVHAPVSTKYEPGNDDLLRMILGDHVQPRSSIKNGTLHYFASELIRIRGEEASNMHPDERGAFIPRLFRSSNVATQPGQIFHREILIRLENFLSSHGMNFYDAINLAPWEYNWYGYFAGCIDEAEVIGVSSPIVHFASDEAISDARKKGVTFEALRQRFVAIQMAARHFDTLEF